MAATLTIDGRNCNDGTNYQLLYGSVFGEKVLTYDVQKSWDGNITQTNVSYANEIPMTIGLRVKGATLAALNTNWDNINTSLEKATFDIVFNDGSGAQTFHCLTSQRVPKPYDDDWFTNLRGTMVLQVLRKPA